jgi:hypothetical protein
LTIGTPASLDAPAPSKTAVFKGPLPSMTVSLYPYQFQGYENPPRCP